MRPVEASQPVREQRLAGRNLLGLALFAPLLAHVFGIAVAVLPHRAFTFKRLDFLVFLVTVGYAVVAVLVLQRRAHATRFIALVYSAVLTLCALEIFFHFRLPLAQLPQLPSKVTSVAANTMPGITGEITFSINTLGVRGPPDKWDKSDLRILCVGGSTVECRYVTDEKSWPWLTGTRLAEQMGRNVFVGNAGKSGQIVRHHDYLLRHFKYTDRFDWIVVMCGINDLGALLRANYQERVSRLAEDTMAVGESEGPYYKRLVCVTLVSTFMGGKSGLALVQQDRVGQWYTQVRAARKEQLRKHTFTNPPDDLRAALTQYRRDLEQFVLFCEERKKGLVLMTQPTLYHTNMPPALADLLWEYTDDGAYSPEALASLMQAYNQTMISVCQDHRVDCLDLASLLPKDTSAFYDDAHLNTSGCEQVARIVSDHLSQLLRSDSIPPASAQTERPRKQ